MFFCLTIASSMAAMSPFRDCAKLERPVICILFCYSVWSSLIAVSLFKSVPFFMIMKLLAANFCWTDYPYLVAYYWRESRILDSVAWLDFASSSIFST